MKLTQLDVVQVPLGLPDEIQEEMIKAVTSAGTVNIPWRTWAYMVIIEKLHFLGLHQWANLRTFDPASQRLLYTGRWACLICSKVRK